jgi:DNA ligase-1
MSQSAPFVGLAKALDELKGTSSKKEKVSIFAGFLKGLGPDDAQFAARFAGGRSSQRGSKDEAQVGYSTLLEVVKEVTGATESEVSKVYLKHGDLGEVAEDLLEKKKIQTLFSEPLTLLGLEESFGALRSAKGKGSGTTRQAIVRSLLLRASPLEGKYIVKVLTGEMRTGLVSGLLEEAIAEAYSIPKDEAARAHMVVGDIGTLARAAVSGSLSGIKMQPFRPVNFMLAEPLATASEVAEHFGKKVYAEYKYDGVRAQVHRRGGQVRIYSRRLEEITDSFPELAETFERRGDDFIMDGEVVPFADGKPLPFQLLQRRLRRMADFEEARGNAPVVLFAFDLLLIGPNEITGQPLAKRRKLLSKLVEGTAARLAETVDVKTAEETLNAFRKSRDLGYEGLVIKDPESVYTMGARGSGWVKLKEELDTLDTVIVAAEYGHGKRAGVISDYTFAVKDGAELKTVGKAYSGLTDKEIDEMTRKLKEITLVDHGYWRTVKPEVVVEVAFDSIQKSTRHNSGYALRFPRIKRIRTDKSVSDIDNLERVRRVFEGQKLKVEEPLN